MTKLSIILPCYNEGATIGALVESYRQALAGVSDVELIIVDNGSIDDTPSYLAEEIARTTAFPIRVVTVPVNIGYGHGIISGLQQARGEFLAWSHSDLQCPAADTVALFHAVMATDEPERCFGKGSRVTERGKMGIFARLQSVLSHLILGYKLVEINAQPKLFHRRFFDDFKAPPNGFELDIYAYYKAARRSFQIVSVDVHFLTRQSGQSKWAYSPFSVLRFMARNFIYLLKLRLMGGKI